MNKSGTEGQIRSHRCELTWSVLTLGWVFCDAEQTHNQSSPNQSECHCLFIILNSISRSEGFSNSSLLLFGPCFIFCFALSPNSRKCRFVYFSSRANSFRWNKNRCAPKKIYWHPPRSDSLHKCLNALLAATFSWEPVPRIFPSLSEGVLLKQWLCVVLSVSWKKGHPPLRGACWKAFQRDGRSLESLHHFGSLWILCWQMRPESFFFLLTYRDQMISENSISNMSPPMGVDVGRLSDLTLLWCKVSCSASALICLCVIDSYYYGVIKAFDREQERGLGLCLG